jgi:hypothetical protein
MTILNFAGNAVGPAIESKTSCGSNSFLKIDCCGWGLQLSGSGLPEYELQGKGRDTVLQCAISNLESEVLIYREMGRT